MTAEALRPLFARIAVFVAILIVIAGTFYHFAPAYLSERNILAILRQMSVNGIVSIGLTFVIVLNRFDLSLAGVASLCAMTLGFLLAETASLYPALAGAIAMGMFCGALSGLLVGRFRLPDVVTTIAIGSIAYGMAFIYSGGAHFSSNFFSTGMLDINDGKVLFIPLPVFVLLVAATAAFVVLHLSRYGQSFYAVGENPLSARLSGVPVKLYVAAGFAICGALVGAAMILNVAAVGATYVNTGNRILLPAYTAVYLGAALFGSATIPATLAGVLLMGMLLNGFTILSVPYYYSDAVVSAILIAAIAIFSPQTLTWLQSALRLATAKPQPARRSGP
ncbi:MAG: ABC transporter permease [Rhodospirillales bacterium]